MKTNTRAQKTKTTKTTKTTRTTKKSSGRSKAKLVWSAIGLILLPVAVGLIASAITMDVMESFGALNQPPFAPPAWLFPVAWTILYILMGVASFLIYKQNPRSNDGKILRRSELVVYFLQLFFNFWWTLFFFKFELRFFAFGWLIVMWAMILALVIMTGRNSKAAMWCLIPYLAWTTFAAVLNISIAILN